MNYCKNTISFLEKALGSELTSSQKTIVYLHSSLNDDKFDVANFAIENRLSPSIYVAKLASFGSLVENFWQMVLPNKVNEYQNDPELLIRDLSEYEENRKSKADLGFLAKKAFSEAEIDEVSKNMSVAMAKALNDNKRLVGINLDYLVKIGVNNYKDIFKSYYELFLLDHSSFEDIFNKYDQDDLVEKLAKNVAIIEYL